MATMTTTMTFQDSEIVALENAFWDALRTRDGVGSRGSRPTTARSSVRVACGP